MKLTVRKILKGKDIEWIGKGYYNRSIGGKSHKKVLVGNPKWVAKVAIK